MERKDIKSMTLSEISSCMTENEPSYRAKQCFSWLHQKRVKQFGDMTNIPKALQKKWEESFEIVSLKLEKMQESRLDGTKKFLFRLPDDNLVESVFLPYKHGNCVCVSSQIGCRMGCKFCASTLQGLKRNLRPSEILEQIYEIQRLTGEKISNVVVMGMGEPLDNYSCLIRFLRLLSHESGMNLGQRNITVSTCGLVPQIKQLAEEKLQITLALSLHAPTDEKRKTIMPIAGRYSLSETMQACKEYSKKTGRRMTFEYSLIKGFNDSKEDARRLAQLADSTGSHVNLIPVNPVRERGYEQSGLPQIAAFQKELEKSGINVTIRREMGRDIDGACGQLRQRYMDSQ